MLCTPAIFYSVVGTMMIAVEATQAGAVVLPMWFFTLSSHQVSGGTDLSADATPHAAVTHHMEGFVCNKNFLKECSEEL